MTQILEMERGKVYGRPLAFLSRLKKHLAISFCFQHCTLILTGDLFLPEFSVSSFRGIQFLTEIFESFG